MKHFTWPIGYRVVKVGIRDLLGAPVEAIVSPANSGLSYGGGLGAEVSKACGPALDGALDHIRERIGRIPVGRCVPTNGYDSGYKAVIHAVAPRLTGTKIKHNLKTLVHNCMYTAHKLGCKTIAFPAFGAGIFGVPPRWVATAFHVQLPKFFERFSDTPITCVWICLTIDRYPDFKEVLS